MVDGGGHPRLVRETAAEGVVAGQLGGEQLQRHHAVEPQVPGTVHHGHSAAADLPLHAVPGDLGPDEPGGPPGVHAHVMRNRVHRVPPPRGRTPEGLPAPFLKCIEWARALRVHAFPPQAEERFPGPVVSDRGGRCPSEVRDHRAHRPAVRRSRRSRSSRCPPYPARLRPRCTSLPGPSGSHAGRSWEGPPRSCGAVPRAGAVSAPRPPPSAPARRANGGAAGWG